MSTLTLICRMEKRELLKQNCSNCAIRELCFTDMALNQEDMRRLDGLVKKRRKILKGEHIYRLGEQFAALFVIRMGSFKSIISNEQGQEKVLDFNMIGDFLGLDGFANNQHESSAIALEDAEVCILDRRTIKELSHSFNPLNTYLQKTLGAEIVRNNNLSMAMRSMNAEQKIASFLLNLSYRFKMRQQPENEFYLKMSREDIGSYTDLTIETVSRTLKKLEKAGIVTIKAKLVTINNVQKIKILLDDNCLHNSF
jgi:CRP/FNR family transcriptional regulator